MAYPSQSKAYYREYYRTHREHRQATQRRWYHRHKRRYRNIVRARLQTPEAKLKRNLAWKKKFDSDPLFAMTVRLRALFSTTLKRFLIKKRNSVLGIVGCSMSDFCVHIEAQFLPGMTWENRGQWHLDHKRPVASFDLSDPEQVKACFHYSNFQPLWALDNVMKSDSVQG